MTLAPAASAREQRDELAFAAARAERANQPRHLLWLAVLGLAVALLVLSFAARARSRALAKLDTERATAQRIVDSAARLRALEGMETDASGSRAAQPETFLNSRIQGAGVTAGLRDRVALPKTRPRANRPPGMDSEQIKLEFEHRDPSLEALLRWMRQATQDVPGLEVYSLVIEPEAQAWKIKVTFSRWQRAEGT